MAIAARKHYIIIKSCCKARVHRSNFELECQRLSLFLGFGPGAPIGGFLLIRAQCALIAGPPRPEAIDHEKDEDGVTQKKTKKHALIKKTRQEECAKKSARKKRETRE
jgi:hypothetical protein